MAVANEEFDCVKMLETELQQLEGIQRQNPESGDNAGQSEYFYSRYTNRLFGAPYQLLHSVDFRFPNTNPNIGNEYLRNFLLNAPILEIKAGIPMYTYQQNWIDEYTKRMIPGRQFTWGAVLKYLWSFFTDTAPQLRMFTFANRYLEYMAHVNYMCRSMAYLLNLRLESDGDNKSSNTPNTDSSESRAYPSGVHMQNAEQLEPYNDCRWENYRMTNGEAPKVPSADSSLGSNLFEQTVNLGARVFSRSYPRMASFLAALGLFDKENLQASVDKGLDYGVKFLVEPTSVNENLENNVTESVVSQTINGLYNSVGTEVAFLMDSNALGPIGDAITSTLQGAASGLAKVTGELVSAGLGSEYVNNLTSSIGNTLRGQKMIYPQVYKDSRYSTNYSFVVHLNSPYGDVYNYYMNIIVPLMHLICLAAPRLITGNGTKAPYIVQACIPGMCTIDMGMITKMEITKNKNRSHVSVDGFPLDIDVNFTIEELYSSLPISSAFSPASFLTNETLNNYLASMAGLRPSFDTRAKVLALTEKSMQDYAKHWPQWAIETLATGQGNTN